MTESINNQTPLANSAKLKNYTIIKQLGKGGFGVTYLALDDKLNRPVAIKEYFPDAISFRSLGQTYVSVLSTDKQADYQAGLRRFQREAMLLSQFKHPNIVQVLGLFDDNNTAYFVMEYIEGQSLDGYQKEKNRALTEQEIIKQCLPVLNGLKEVHNKGMLHLDIKPDNIIQTKYGQPLLIDFGGARVDTSKLSKDLSQHSAMVATDGFAPTEQYSLATTQSPATDIYAVGMTLYKLIAPQVDLPRSSDRQELVFSGQLDPLKPIREVAKGYSEVLYQAIEACTQLKQKDRPQSVEALQSLLDPLYSQSLSDGPEKETDKTQVVEPVIPQTGTKQTAPENQACAKKGSVKGVALGVSGILVFFAIWGIIQVSEPNEYILNIEADQARTNKLDKIQKVLEKGLGNDFIKVSNTGEKLTASASNWTCVYDRSTNLYWEVKTDEVDGGVRDYRNVYRWGGLTSSSKGYKSNKIDDMYQADVMTEYLLKEAEINTLTHFNDWNVLVNAANDQALCGFSDWRLPSIIELKSLLSYYSEKNSNSWGEKPKLFINTDFFPTASKLGVFGSYWSANSFGKELDKPFAWRLHQADRNQVSLISAKHKVRLVR